MDNIYEKIENGLDKLTEEERKEILLKLRDEIDVIDKEVVHLLSKRTLHSVLIGRVKRSLGMVTYNPQREKQIAERISNFVEEPLSKEAIIRIYERIIDESRAIQREESDKGNIFNIPMKKMKVSFGKLLSKKEFFLVLFFFFAFFGILYYTFFTANYYKEKAPVTFIIKKGEPLTNIVDDLYSKGIIPSKTNMRIAVFVYGAEKRIRAARYHIPNGLSYLDLIDLFLRGKADFLKNVTIANGSSLGWVAEKLHNSVFADSAKVYQLAHNKNFIDSLGLKEKSLLGYLLPETYHIYERTAPRKILDKMYNGFQNFMVDTLKQRAVELGYSLHDVITVASIVQGETQNKEEMPKIASVYYNRLKRGMKLQADPTVQFIIPGKWKRLLYEDLQIDSPYNTYKYAGLPPGPINNPGKAAIIAALYPAKDKYLYFVADGEGGHYFSKSFNEHIRHVRQYKKWLKSQKRN